MYQNVCRWLECVVPKHFRAVRHFVDTHTNRVGCCLSPKPHFERKNTYLASEVDANGYGSSYTSGARGLKGPSLIVSAS